MTDATDSDWPRYDVGPRECMFGLGVVGVKYAQLEFALSGVFSTVTGTKMAAVSRLFAKIRNPARLERMRKSLVTHGWPSPVIDRVQRFIDGFNACASNRNLLMHSNIFMMSKDAIILYKSNNSGRTVSCNPTLAEVRQVADDMNTYFDYGLALSNAINMNLPMSSAYTPFPWPDKPSLPSPLNYMGGPQIVRRMYSDQ